jgi:hypothetical protein
MNNTKKILKNFNVKKNMLSNAYMNIIGYIITIILICFIIYYLNNLKSCKCFQDKNIENYSNIDYLIILEGVILFINILAIIIMLFLIKYVYYHKGGAKTNGYYIINVILLFLYIYFIYNVYKLYKNIDNNCLCTQSWLRYLIYIQTFIMIIRIIFILHSFFT